MNGYQYQCIVSGACSPVATSGSATLTVNLLPTASATGGISTCQNGGANITTANASNGNILWTSDGVGTLYNETTLTPSYSAAAGDGGNTVTLTMTVSNGLCPAATATFPIYVSALPTSSISGNTSFCTGGSTILTANTDIGTAFQWYDINGPISDATASTYVVVTGGDYTVMVTNGTCQTLSSDYLVTLNASASISSQPTSSTICAGNNVSFSVGAPVATLTYQWMEDQGSGMVNLFDGGIYSNSATATLSLTGAPVSMNGYQYQCVVSGLCFPASTVSSPVVLTVNGPMSGTYAIDASGNGDYATFTAAIADLDCRGVSGAVTFNVAPGTYVETISIDNITGISATNTITFNGRGYSNVTLTDGSAAAPATGSGAKPVAPVAGPAPAPSPAPAPTPVPKPKPGSGGQCRYYRNRQLYKFQWYDSDSDFGH